ncbi:MULTISPECIES: hypothetical protein [Microbacterium]|uniref:hypothetical protein n=1 Tax=Microbacterium TaxID=33882 RepID=UPI00277FE262|nr:MULTISPECIES: hypothetical protein [Microbacterium]MDQ1083041.1 hypothetical protein [Microbacterium sp. SORGH_AS_0344]MDQ1171688.1 hypothetical protein [Microbacterium proteolyticum]
MQQRGDIAAQRVQVRVTNTSDAPITVTAARLSSAALEAPAGGDTKRPVTIGAGRTTDLPVALSAIRCTSGDPSPRVALRLGDDEEPTVAATDALGVLGRLSATQCDRDAVASIAHVSATAVTPAVDGFAGLVLSIEPSPDAAAGSVDLVALRGTPLLRFRGGGEAALGLRIAGGDPASEITVPVTPIRCDAHAIAEDKVGTLFDLVARVGGREVVVPLDRSSRVAADLLVFTAATCGLTPG